MFFVEAKKLDDTMWLDMAFVEEQYEELMEKKLKQNLMDVLSKQVEKISSAKALVAAKLISGGDLVATQKKVIDQCFQLGRELAHRRQRGPRAQPH